MQCPEIALRIIQILERIDEFLRQDEVDRLDVVEDRYDGCWRPKYTLWENRSIRFIKPDHPIFTDT